MKITLQIQILPDTDQTAKLKAIMERFNAAANWVVGELFAAKVTNKIEAQKRLYTQVRDRFGLGAQTAILCIHRACEAYRRDTSILPVFRPDAAITYDVRTLSFKGPDRVSLVTLSGRIVMPFIMGGYQAERIGYPKGQSDLIYRDGEWYCLVTVDIPDGTEVPVTDFIGIDLGIVDIATDSDGGQMSGEKVEKARRKYGDRRKTLQEAATRRKRSGRRPRSIRRRIAKDKAREARYKRDVNHCTSKEYVESARRTGRGIALEDLEGIRDRVTARGGDARNRLHGWSFFQFRSFLSYKAQLAGVPVVFVDPAYTSKDCAGCGHRDGRNRKTQATFRCVSCGHTDNADRNAARNIRARARVMWAQGVGTLAGVARQTAR